MWFWCSRETAYSGILKIVTDPTCHKWHLLMINFVNLLNLHCKMKHVHLKLPSFFSMQLKGSGYRSLVMSYFLTTRGTRQSSVSTGTLVPFSMSELKREALMKKRRYPMSCEEISGWSWQSDKSLQVSERISTKHCISVRTSSPPLPRAREVSTFACGVGLFLKGL